MKSDSYDEHLSPLLWSVQTASFYTTNFHEVIKACVDSGFTSIELGLSRNTISLSKEEVIETFMTYGVNIRSVHQRLEVNMVNNYPFLSPYEILQRFKRYVLSSSLLNN